MIPEHYEGECTMDRRCFVKTSSAGALASVLGPLEADPRIQVIHERLEPEKPFPFPGLRPPDPDPRLRGRVLRSARQAAAEV